MQRTFLAADTDAEFLAAFSFEEEAHLYLRFTEASDKGRWRLERIEAPELAGLLSDPRCGFRWVALDPIPELCTEELLSLVSVRREEFLGFLTDMRRPVPSPLL